MVRAYIQRGSDISNEKHRCYVKHQNDKVCASSRAFQVILSITSGHDTPAPVSGIDYVVQYSAIQDSTMAVDAICRNCTQHLGSNSVDTTSAKQPWIYAIGPGQPVSSDSQDANIEKHSNYGM
jgi:hypothetical protein